MLETVRAYAEDRLVEAGEADSTREALAAWLLARLESEPLEELYADTSGLIAFVASELDNLYASLDWAAARSDCELVVRLATPAALSMWEAADATLRPIIGHVRACLDAGIDGEVRHMALAAEIMAGWALGDRRPDLVRDAGDVPPHRDDDLAVIRLCRAAILLDAWGRVTSDQEIVDEGRRLLDRAATVASGHIAVIRALPTYYRAICALSTTDWEGSDQLFEDAGRIQARHPRFFEWHCHATARLGAGRPFDRAEIDMPDEWRQTAEHLPGGIDVYIDAVCGHRPERPRKSMALDRQDLDRFLAGNSIWVRNLLISVAQLAAREHDWNTAAVLLANARRGLERDIFASPGGVTLYRLTVAPVREALAKDMRDALIKEARQMDLAAGLDLAVEWLAGEPRRLRSPPRWIPHMRSETARHNCPRNGATRQPGEAPIARTSDAVRDAIRWHLIGAPSNGTLGCMPPSICSGVLGHVMQAKRTRN